MFRSSSSKMLPICESRARCWGCQQVCHFFRECPKPKRFGKGSAASASSDRPTAASSAAMVEDRLITDVNVGAFEVFLVTSPGFGIIDSGCGRTLIGQCTLNSLFRLLAKAVHDIPMCFDLVTSMRLTVQVCDAPCKLGTVDAWVIQGTAPLLLSRNTMKSLGAVLDFQKKTLSFSGGKPQKVVVNEAGQFVISIMDFPPKCNMMKGDRKFNLGEGEPKVLSRKEARGIESLAASWQKGRSTCVVAELFSPPGFAKEPERQGLRGLSFDIKNCFDLLDS